MHASGILLGLAAAAFQTGSYLCSRLFVLRRQDAVLRLLVTSHVIMGAASLAALPFVWSPAAPPAPVYATAMVGVSVFYLVGQAGFFFLVRTSDASRVVPLLGFKIVMLAAIAVVFQHRVVTAGQWAAVALSVAAALLLNFSGKGLARASLLWMGVVCLGYSLSDLNIEQFVLRLAPVPHYRASLIAVSLSYAMCGAVALALLPAVHRKVRLTASDWRDAAPFSAFWLLGMVFLFACFGVVGPVFGNVLQSTRGLMSVLVGALVARQGYVHLEAVVGRRILLRRVLAAALMVAAIWLFGRSR